MNRIQRLLRPFAAVTAGFLVIAGARPLAAQRVSIAPTVGLYIPTTELLKAANGEEFKQEVSITVGGRLAIWFADRVGVEGTGTYAPSDLTFSATGGSVGESANLFTGSARLSIFLIPNTSPISFLLSGGLGIVSRSGTAYQNIDNTTDIAGTFGAAVGFRLGRILNLSVAADSYIYNSEAFNTSPLAGAATQTQRDIQLSFGFGIPLVGM